MDLVPNASQSQLLELLVSRLEDFVVILTDSVGHFNFWHPGIQRTLGFSEDEFFGRPIDLIFPCAEVTEGSTNRELQLARDKGCVSTAGWLVHKNGAQIFVEGVTLGLRSSNGTFLGFGKIFTDVTARKKADDKLRTFSRALDQSAVIVRTWDGVIQHWTVGCQHLYGWSAEQAVGQICQELLRTEFNTPFENIQRELLEKGSWQGDLQHTRADGTVLAISAFWVLMRDELNRAHLVIETQTDITGRERMRRELEGAHEELKRIRDELERSNEELEEFARIASHDLSAPLTSTRWLVDILRDRHSSQLDTDGKNCLEHIALGLARMADLVEGVLTHARLGRELLSTNVQAEAAQAFTIAVDNLQSEIESSSSLISSGDLPKVAVSPQALAQLFQNLLSNAIKYRRPAVRPVITVSAEQQGSMWLFSVQDNGLGIQQEWMERIFQPMQRLAGSDVPGSGIGLATCRKIVRRAGGSIWVESQFGAGSNFLFTLPATPEPS